MTKQINVPESVDDTKKLQNLIDNTGNIPTEYIFNSDDIECNLPIKVYNNTKFTGNNVKFTLMDNASTSLYGIHIPMIGSKYLTGITGLEFSYLVYDGNYATQKYATAAGEKDHGAGYHDFIVLGNINNSTVANAQNIFIHDITAGFNQGDEVRIEGGANVHTCNITSEMGGHDVVNYKCVTKGEIDHLNVKMRSNNAVRVRSCNGVQIHDIIADGSTNMAWAPAIQGEGEGVPLLSTSIYNCYIHDTFGSAIWFMGENPNNKYLSIYNNLMVNCGKMPANNKISGVGGIILDGINNARILSNTIDGSDGYGIGFANYQSSNGAKGMTALIQDNIITNTGRAYYPDANSGTAIANVLGHYTVTSNNNCLYGNVRNYYNVAGKDMYVDPCYVGNGDYHLQSKGGHYTDNGLVYDSITSPYIYIDNELGCYSKTNQSSVYFPPPTHVNPNDLIGDSPAVIILCKTSDEAGRLTLNLKDSSLITDQKIIYYSS